jgi:hypothetical protein
LESRLERLRNALSREHFASNIQAARQSKMKELIAFQPRVARQPSAAQRILAATFRGIGSIVQLVTPTSRDRLSKFLPIGDDKELEQQMVREFESLFTNHGARIHSNGRVGIMDFATVTFNVENLRVSATRDRGFIHVRIAPIHAVREWHDLVVAVQALQENNGTAQNTLASNMRGAGRLMETNLAKLTAAFSETQYPATRERIRELSDKLEQEWIENFNRRMQADSRSKGISSP